jgi:hypothetical protein
VIRVQLASIRDTLKTELEDMADVLKGEEEARVAATEELNARLAAKERAEEEKEAAENKFLRIERQYLSMVNELANAQDNANVEVCAEEQRRGQVHKYFYLLVASSGKQAQQQIRILGSATHQGQRIGPW